MLVREKGEGTGGGLVLVRESGEDTGGASLVLEQYWSARSPRARELFMPCRQATGRTVPASLPEF